MIKDMLLETQKKAIVDLLKECNRAEVVEIFLGVIEKHTIEQMELKKELEFFKNIALDKFIECEELCDEIEELELEKEMTF